MHIQIRSERHRAAEPEEGVQQIEHEWEERGNCQAVLYRCGDEVKEGEHCKDGAEHAVVDDGRGAGKGVGDHVADECHDEESPEELHDFDVRTARGVALGAFRVPGAPSWRD